MFLVPTICTGLIIRTFPLDICRGVLSNATFGSGKKLHWPKFALAKLVQKIALME